MGDRNFKILVPDGNNEYQSQGRLLESGFEHTCQKLWQQVVMWAQRVNSQTGRAAPGRCQPTNQASMSSRQRK